MATVSTATLPELRRMSTTLRRWIIDQSLESHVGHIGSALSIVEMIAVLWGHILRDVGSEQPDRDRFILSKGHAALALYSALRYRGLIDADTFHTFCNDGSPLAAHPEFSIPGVEISTGSLGQGLSVGCGLALGLRQQGSAARVYVLMSDAECNEGQVWEAAMFAAHRGLGNLIVLVDLNGLQALGQTADVVDMQPMAQRWRSFGWQTQEVDGHDEADLLQALTSAGQPSCTPSLLVAHTRLGKGVSFMENRLEWHYRPLTADLANQALTEIGFAS